MINIHYYKDYMYDVISAIHEVHCELGAGLNESCYQEGLRIQLEEQDISFQKELVIHPSYHGKAMDAVYRIDFLCKGDIVIECKSVDELNCDMRAQLYNYMRLLRCTCGILVNFAGKKATVERYFYNEEEHDILTVDGRVVHKYRP